MDSVPWNYRFAFNILKLTNEITYYRATREKELKSRYTWHHTCIEKFGSGKVASSCILLHVTQEKSTHLSKPDQQVVVS
jgi:hypothetical protein